MENNWGVSSFDKTVHKTASYPVGPPCKETCGFSISRRQVTGHNQNIKDDGWQTICYGFEFTFDTISLENVFPDRNSVGVSTYDGVRVLLCYMVFRFLRTNDDIIFLDKPVSEQWDASDYNLFPPYTPVGVNDQPMNRKAARKDLKQISRAIKSIDH